MHTRCTHDARTRCTHLEVLLGGGLSDGAQEALELEPADRAVTVLVEKLEGILELGEACSSNVAGHG